MAPLDIVLLYPSVRYELVKESIKKRWKDIHKHTKMNLAEFLKGLESLMNSLYIRTWRLRWSDQSIDRR